jgi:hypothetical protein
MQQWDEEGDGMMLEGEYYGDCLMEGGATPPLMEEKK